MRLSDVKLGPQRRSARHVDRGPAAPRQRQVGPAVRPCGLEYTHDLREPGQQPGRIYPEVPCVASA
jgi:hypothetical protein